MCAKSFRSLSPSPSPSASTSVSTWYINSLLSLIFEKRGIGRNVQFENLSGEEKIRDVVSSTEQRALRFLIDFLFALLCFPLPPAREVLSKVFSSFLTKLFCFPHLLSSSLQLSSSLLPLSFSFPLPPFPPSTLHNVHHNSTFPLKLYPPISIPIPIPIPFPFPFPDNSNSPPNTHPPTPLCFQNRPSTLPRLLPHILQMES